MYIHVSGILISLDVHDQLILNLLEVSVLIFFSKD